MFLDELTPFIQELTAHPAAFLGGLASGLLRLNLADDPVKGWLNTQGADLSGFSDAGTSGNSRNGGAPKSIAID